MSSLSIKLISTQFIDEKKSSLSETPILFRSINKNAIALDPADLIRLHVLLLTLQSFDLDTASNEMKDKILG